MKTIKTITPATINAIEKYLAYSEKYKNAYFWSPPGNAAARRSMEFDYTYEAEGIYLNFKLECSCKNVYISKTSMIDDVACNILKLKNLLKKQIAA